MIKKTSFLFITYALLFLLSHPLSAQIKLPDHIRSKELPVAKITPTVEGEMVDGDYQYRIQISYLNNYKLNEAVPEEKRLTLVLENSSKSFKTKDFHLSKEGAELTFTEGAPPSGKLTLYLCRPDRCQRLQQTVTWKK